MKKTAMALMVLAITAISVPAFAHGDIATSDPADGARLKKVPEQVRVTFTETPARDSKFVVKDGCGEVVGDPTVDGKALVVQVADAQPGSWSARWDVLSAEDGHQTEGAITFKVAGKPDCSEDEEPADQGDDIGDAGEPIAGDEAGGGGIPSIVWIGAVAGLALVGLALFVRRSSGT